jgi:7-keto-8-aminopelargonate synthetase-like enzyme
MVRAVSKNLEILAREPEGRARLWSNTRQFHQGLREIGVDIGSTVSPIAPIRINGDHDSLRQFGV